MDKQNTCGCAECPGRPIRTQGGADSGYRPEPYINRLYVALRQNTLTFSHNMRRTNANML